MVFSGQRPVTGQLPCPHMIERIRRVEDLPEQANQERCDVYHSDWFRREADGKTAQPYLISQGGHVVYRNCFTEQRASSLACVFPPRMCPVQAPLNPDHCKECRDWERGDAKIVLTVSDDMIGFITDELGELAEDDDFFKIPLPMHTLLRQHYVFYDIL